MKFILNKDVLTIKNNETIKTGSINFYETDVEYDETWNDLTIKAIFTKKDYEEPLEIEVVDKKLVINIEDSDLCFIGFIGYKIEKGEKTYQISTNLEKIDVEKGAGEITPETEEIEESIKMIRDVTLDEADASGRVSMVKLFTELPELTFSPDITNLQNLFSGFANLKAIPKLNILGTIVNMSSMFNGCSRIKEVPDLDTSECTNLYNIFSGCTALTKVPNLNTSKCTGFSSMFYNCSSLTEIPDLDVSKSTGINNMCAKCTSLVKAPTMDTIAIQYMQTTFDGCTNLTTIPTYNLTALKSAQYCFRGCPNLSDESLNNILLMFSNAKNSTSKTLQQLGLTEAQANKCKSLSNWTKFANAGWSTGY